MEEDFIVTPQVRMTDANTCIVERISRSTIQVTFYSE